MERTTRIPALITAVLAMLLTAIPLAGAQELPPGGTFIDDDRTIYEPSIEALVAAGITDGCTTERYCPYEPVTRGQMASFLADALDGLEPTEEDFFSDDESSVHESAINLIAANGIAQGYDADTFGPADPVTRGQMASFLARGLDGLTPTDEDFFPDDEDSPHEANIDLLAANDIVRGFADGTYGPATDIIRGEMAIMLVRALDLTPIEPPARDLPVEPIAAVDGDGNVVVLDAFTGITTRTLMSGIDTDDPADNHIALAPDHQTAYVSVPGTSGVETTIVAVDTITGATTEIAAGTSPAISPDGSTLAFIAFEDGDISPEPVVVVRDLASDTGDRILRGVDAESTFVFIADLEWTTDGSALAFVAGEIQTGAYLLDASAADLGEATRLGPTAREEGSSWYEVAAFESGLAVAESCCGVPSERSIVLLLSLDPLTVEGPLLPEEFGPSDLSSAGASTLVFVGELETPELTGTLYRWEPGSAGVSTIADGYVVADG